MKSQYLSESIEKIEDFTDRKVKVEKLNDLVKITMTFEEAALAALAIGEFVHTQEQGGLRDEALVALTKLQVRLMRIAAK